MKPERISIMGCGWLGLPLGERLIKDGFTIKGSTTTRDKLSLLKAKGIQPFEIIIHPSEGKGVTYDEFFDSNILFLNIPFLRSFKNPLDYYHQIKKVVAQIERSAISQIIFASSTSVYPSSLKDAREDSLFKPQDERAAVLNNIEKEVLNNAHFQCAVLRFAGLFGVNRNLGKRLMTGEPIASPDEPVNLVHQDDCIEIICRLIAQGSINDVFNVCCDGHPTRRELYQRVADVHKIGQISFQKDSSPAQGKVVNNNKLKKFLRYQYKYPHPFDALSL